MSQEVMLNLSRWQWALTAAMHITFPAVTVGVSVLLVTCYAIYMRTGDERWLQTFRFWRRIFVIAFALGVVSGIVLTFEFGLNWGPYARAVGPIVGTMILMEVLMGFFLEAGFLGIVVYGEGRTGTGLMLFSTCMVSLGTILSVTWIMVANSWMQTPAGYAVVNGQFQPTNWVQVIFNPSSVIRFIHMLIAALFTAGWLVAGISAWYFVKSRHLAVARRGLSLSLGAMVVLLPLQIFVGDRVASDYVAPYKLPEIEAMEGNWTSTNTAENIIVIPNQNGGFNYFQIGIPWLGSAAGAKDLSGRTPVPGLLLTPKNLRPEVLPTFYGFHLMWIPTVPLLWLLIVSIALRLRGRLYSSRWFHKTLVWLTPIGLTGIWGGWILAETGRQPWVVYGKLLTANGVSPLQAAEVLTTLALFILIYGSLMAVFIYAVVRIVRLGPVDSQLAEPPAAGAPEHAPLTSLKGRLLG